MRLRYLGLLLLLGLLACAQESNSLDPRLEPGQDVYGEVCSTCHRPDGSGGAGANLSDVLEVFPSCSEQIEWITLGSSNWREEKGDTYGAIDREITGVMPGFEPSLTPEEIAQVAAYERVRFGAGEVDSVLADCGL